MDAPDLRKLLKTHWGYSDFRPKQEAIVNAILGGRDAAVVMPTGGGKSLCYQLPAVASERTCVVISPLIALMQDQAASMREIGIPAAFLNSTLDSAETREVKRRATSGELRLLYLSPERMVRPEVLEWLRKVPIGFFAIDEAHCISEWGHEFRPEYRQLRTLRERFPDVPIAAFTASATRQVRHDILAQLQLRDPARFVMSFHRPNLRYIIHKCEPREQERLLDGGPGLVQRRQHDSLCADDEGRGRARRDAGQEGRADRALSRPDGVLAPPDQSGAVDDRREARAGRARWPSDWESTSRTCAP